MSAADNEEQAGAAGEAGRQRGSGARDIIGAVGEAGEVITRSAARAARRGPARIVDTFLWGPGHRSEPGAAPGTLVTVPHAAATTIDVIAFDAGTLVSREQVGVDEVRSLRDGMPVMWINVEGLADVDTIRSLGEVFEIHDLVLEDVVSVHQRAKFERYGDHHFVVSRMAMIDEGLRTEQVSIYFGGDFVLTFQEGLKGDAFDRVRRRLHAGADRLRERGADFLAYTLIDAVVDSYFPLLEQYGETLAELEDELLFDPHPSSMARIHDVKRDLLALRRAVWPQREALATLARTEGGALITEETRAYLLDALDHTVQIIDLLETYRELASGLVDLYLSSVSNRMNEVMKVLTIIATIFIPLSFIAGVYGMNFDPRTSPWNMPELRWYLGYPMALGVMLVVALALVGYFWHKGWLTDDAPRPQERRRRRGR